MKKTIIAILFAFSQSFVLAAEAPAKVAQCNACHGADGASPIQPAYPKLNGQNKEYLISALKDYKNGKRTGALSVIMNGQAAMLTDVEIDALATFYSSK